jgi:hypothetical protein
VVVKEGYGGAGNPPRSHAPLDLRVSSSPMSPAVSRSLKAPSEMPVAEVAGHGEVGPRGPPK